MKGDRPASFNFTTNCKFCASYKLRKISFDNYQDYCELWGFEFNYKDESYHKVCEDFLDEEEID